MKGESGRFSDASCGRCWRSEADAAATRLLAPLVALSFLAAAFLIAAGVIGATVGILLWPAAALRLVLAVLLARAWMGGRAAG